MKQIILLGIIFSCLFLAACSGDMMTGSVISSDVIGEPENVQEIVVIETNKGDIEIELFREKAPVTVDNFISYVNEGFYDGTIFHRVIKNFMIQGGGFTPESEQKETKDPIILESDNGLMNKVGAVAMARQQAPNTATSQFFINTNGNYFLNKNEENPGYAVFGEVISGMEVVRAIEDSETSNKGSFQNWPVEDIIIEKVYVK
jgi:peptidyl-prolyl cis-trans isomerase B (cyclophilin B)